MRVLRLATLGSMSVATAATLVIVSLRDPGRRFGFGLGDCEAHHPGIVAQPVLAWTALGLVGAGVWMAWTWDRIDPAGAAAVALATATAGLASFTAHATLAGGAAVWDAAAVAALLAVIAIRTAGGAWWHHVVAIAGVVTIALTAPAVLEALGLGAALVAVGVLGTTHRRAARTLRWGLVAAALATAGLALWALGRTGAALCDPDTPWQPHGAWHVLAAAALAAVHLHLAGPAGHTPGGGLRSGSPHEAS